MVTVRILLIIWYSLPDEIKHCLPNTYYKTIGYQAKSAGPVLLWGYIRVSRLFPKLRLSSHHGKNAGKNKKASDYFVDGGYFTEY